MVPIGRRDAYAAGVTRVAAPGALLLMVGFSKLLRIGITAEELRDRFSGWKLIRAVPVPGWELLRYVRGAAPMKAALAVGWLEPWRYKLQRT
jgi:hypothetical protein